MIGLVVGVALLLSVAGGAVSSSEYDFVVVGGGNAGIPMAVRLANAGFSVLLLERGPNPSDLSAREAFLADTPRWRYDLWLSSNFTADPLRGGIPNAEVLRGKVLGGTTTINAALWTEPLQGDFDGWNLRTWTDEVMEPFSQRVRNSVSLGFGYPQSWVDEWIDAARRLGYEHGVQRRAVTPDGKHLTSRYYLNHLTVAGRALLTIRTMTWVDQLMFADASAHPLRAKLQKPAAQPRVTGVRFRAANMPFNTSATVWTTEEVLARREVILCAGVFGTPAVLLRSGIGARLAVDLPRVGRGLKARALSFMVWSGPNGQLAPEMNMTLLASQEKLYESTGYGPLGSTISGSDSIASMPLEPRDGEKTQRSKWVLTDHNVVLPSAELGNIFPASSSMAYCLNLEPSGDGTVSLVNNDPFTEPAINLDIAGHEEDMQALARCMLRNRQVFSSPRYPRATTEILPGWLAPDFASMLSYVRTSVQFSYHAYGTCRIGDVVEEDLTVKGITGLRVVDGSVIPAPVRAGLMAVVYAIAERGAQLVIDTHSPRQSATAPVSTI